MKIGDPALDEVRMGPLATAQQLRDVRAGIAQPGRVGREDRRTAAPPRCSTIGADAKGKGYFVGPMLLRAESPRDARAVHEHEVFGPAATLMPYRGADDAGRSRRARRGRARH